MDFSARDGMLAGGDKWRLVSDQEPSLLKGARFTGALLLALDFTDTYFFTNSVLRILSLPFTYCFV